MEVLRVTENQGEFLTIPEVAQALGVSQATLYARRVLDEIPQLRIGRRRIFTRAAVLAWREARMAQVGGKGPVAS